MNSARRDTFLRPRSAGEHARVTNIELFFDLVFVFAVTQLSHALLTHLSIAGAIETLLLFLAVWWAWVYTTWVTNWLDPDKTPVRMLLLALMLAGLVMSASIPEAFAAKGASFASAHVFIQVGRSLFMLWALGESSPTNTRNFKRITAWLACAGVLWLAGAAAHDGMRLALWASALGIEYLAPALGFWTPGLGHSTTDDWDVEGGHMAERCALFIIIALGESVLVTGATFAGLAWEGPTFVAFVVAFLGSAALWWIYFDSGAERGNEHISRSSDPGKLARLVYTYFHLPIVAGIIVSAVGDERILAAPLGPADMPTIAVVLGGPAAYLAGIVLFKWAVCGRLPLAHLVGLAALLGLVPWAPGLTPLALGGATTSILLAVAASERIALQREQEAAARFDAPTVSD